AAVEVVADDRRRLRAIDVRLGGRPGKRHRVLPAVGNGQRGGRQRDARRGVYGDAVREERRLVTLVDVAHGVAQTGVRQGGVREVDRACELEAAQVLDLLFDLRTVEEADGPRLLFELV